MLMLWMKGDWASLLWGSWFGGNGLLLACILFFSRTFTDLERQGLSEWAVFCEDFPVGATAYFGYGCISHGRNDLMFDVWILVLDLLLHCYVYE